MAVEPKRNPAQSASEPLSPLLELAGEVLLGKQQQLRLAVSCLLARGHLLIEDVPGVGKTTLAHLLARLLGLDYGRIQFTSDMLPADILGVSVYDRDQGGFRFHPGPVFAQLVLADEINRATPKAQSALLEAMEEGQVTNEGVLHALPRPFFVIATQNPQEQVGTFPLPESQLDRFLMRIELGYPDPRSERALLAGRDRRDWLAELMPLLDAERLQALQRSASATHVAPALLDYVQALLAASREALPAGLSPRAGLGLLAAARAWAFIAGRQMVIPEDIQAVFVAVAGHRVGAQAARQLLADQPVP
jgi:MoxR-like ATPase